MSLAAASLLYRERNALSNIWRDIKFRLCKAIGSRWPPVPAFRSLPMVANLILMRCVKFSAFYGQSRAVAVAL